jgi:hypothetical protein
MISAGFPDEKKRRSIMGHEMAYVEVGKAIRSCSCTAIPRHPIFGGM